MQLRFNYELGTILLDLHIKQNLNWTCLKCRILDLSTISLHLLQYFQCTWHASGCLYCFSGALIVEFYLLFHYHLANFKYAFFKSDPLLFRYDYYNNSINSLHDIDRVLKLIPEIPNMLLCTGIIQSGKFKQFLLIFNHFALQYG